MIYVIAVGIVAIALVTVLAYGVHTRLRSGSPEPCTADCEHPADTCCRRCLLHEACGVRMNQRNGEIACKLA